MNYKDIDMAEKKRVFLDSVAKFCDKCGSAYSLDDVNILQISEVSAIIHFSCHICKSKYIVSFANPMAMSSKYPINTDLEVEEVKRFSKREVVSLQDILDLYIEIKGKTKITV